MSLGAALETIGKIKDVVELSAPILSCLSERTQLIATRMVEISKTYPKLEGFANALSKVSNVMSNVFYVLGINSEPAEILGAKIAEAEKGMDEFEDAESYIEYLKNEIELDSEKLNNLSPEEKASNTIAGVALQLSVVCEKLDIDIPVDLLFSVSKIVNENNLSSDVLSLLKLVDKIKEKGIFDFTKLLEYFKGSGSSDRIKTGFILNEAFEETEIENADEIIEELKKEYRN